MLVADVIEATVAVSGHSRFMLLGPACARTYARPRQVGMFLSHRLTTASNSKIARIWGGRDNTTVRYALARIEQFQAEGDQEIADLITNILVWLQIDELPATRPIVIARPLLLSRIAAKQRELDQLRADLAALDCQGVRAQAGDAR